MEKIKRSWITLFLISVLMLITWWFEECWWNWANAINCRFVQYNDNIDRLAFFEELNYGWYQMYIYPYDDWYYPTISAQRKLLLNEINNKKE